MKKMLLITILSIIFFLTPNPCFAAYVLPYPSYMPGNKMYRASRIIDELKQYWYWGSIAGTKYHLMLSDKYLVEAKTLFEYGQYQLGADALARSDQQFLKIPQSVKAGIAEGKNMDALKSTVLHAASKHKEVLGNLIGLVPADILWEPEKEEATKIFIKNLLEQAIQIRDRAVEGL